MSALQSGLTVAPMSLVSGLVAPFAGRLADRLGGKYLLMAGLAIFGGGAAWVALIAPTTSTSLDFTLPLVVTGIGLGLMFAPMMTVALQGITPREAAAAFGVINTTRQLGSVLGAAVTGAVLQSQLARWRCRTGPRQPRLSFRRRFAAASWTGLPRRPGPASLSAAARTAEPCFRPACLSRPGSRCST